MVKCYCLKERKVTEGLILKLLELKTIELRKEPYVKVVVFLNIDL